jgi:isopenicillin-N N-acyltransferase-like protein
VTTALRWPGALELGVPAHRSVPSAPYERGYALGAAEPAAVANTVAFYRRLLRDDFALGDRELALAGRHVRGALRRHRREAMIAEIEGIADGAGCERDVLLAVNARTELIAGGRYAAAPGGAGRYRGPRLPGECSVVGVGPGRTASGHGLLAQTWDFHPDLRDSRLLWLVERADGGWLCTFTEAGILGKCGLNSDGVALTLNFLAAADDGGLDGVPVHLLARAVLESEPEDALALLTSTPVSASSALTVAAPGGVAIAGVEVTPQGARTIEPDGELFLHTNHFLRPEGVTDLMLGEEAGADTRIRLDELARSFAARDRIAVADVEAALASHAHAPDAICTHRDGPEHAWIDRVATLASLIMDGTSRRLWFAAGPPCRSPFRPVPLPAA